MAVTLPVSFVVPGKPIPKGRPRASVRGDRVHMRTPPRTVAYEDAVAWAARHAAFGKALDMVEGTGTARPLAVSIVAVLARVGRLDKRGLTAGRVWAHGSTADADNIAKAVLDGMQRGGGERAYPGEGVGGGGDARHGLTTAGGWDAAVMGWWVAH